ncbi:MAG TPA: fimbrillin family protein [Candidatus Parabacteroides intestinigallinarum]|uniref:Fimbrillin family protein n=1 Tax=Candidatus Parabacteroides intestinigallinarum TaxID=2838722 RepID=A0A9D2BPU9_9BACT|nr:fimbrillin family protein [Candidatus Parabacteroides intestinigallinarum]
MKQRFYIMAAAALTLAACSNDENMEMTDGPVAARITAGLSAPTTRAIGTNWNADQIGVWVKDAPTSDMETLYKNVLYTTTSTGATAEFTATTGEGIFFQDANETVTFAAYAPYQPSDDNETLPGNNGKVDVKTDNMNTATDQEKIDFLFAEGAEASRASSTVSFTDDHSFHHKMAQLNVVFQTSETDGFEPDDIFGCSFNLGGLIHEGTFNVTDGTTALTGEPLDSWDISGCKYTDAATTRTYSLILLPQDLTNKALNVKVGIDGQTYSNSDAINPNLQAGYTYTYTITVKKSGLVVSGCTITPWASGSTGSGDAEM